MKKIMIAFSLLVCFSLSGMTQSKHKHLHHGKKHYELMSKKEERKENKTRNKNAKIDHNNDKKMDHQKDKNN